MRAWFQTWKSAPPIPSAATTGWPAAPAATASPTPSTMSPTFSTLE